MDPSENPLASLRDGLLYGHSLGEALPDTVDELRQLLSATQASHERHYLWAKLRELGVNPSNEEASEIFGVFGEIGMPQGSAFIFGLCDGSASMYTSTGGGMIGGGGHEGVRQACSRMIEVAQSLMDYLDVLPVRTEFPYPEPGIMRLGVISAIGVRTVDALEPQLSSGQHKLSPLFGAWNNLVTQLRLTEPEQRESAARGAAPANANCLLTFLAQKSLPPVTLPNDGPLPDLRQMATSADDHNFIDEIGIPPTEVDPHSVRATLMNLAGFKKLNVFKKTGELRCKLAQSQGKLVDVCFVVEKKRNEIVVRLGS